MKILKSILLALALTACAKDSGTGSSATTGIDPAKALPVSWYRLPEEGAPRDAAMPGPVADASVSRVFAATAAPLAQAPGPATSWHLDGMESSFGVSEEGLFAPLLYSGTESIRAKWQLASSSPPAAAAGHARQPGVEFRSSMSEAEVAAELEPVVKVVLRAGSVKDEAALRKNLLKRAMTFLGITRIVDGIPFAPGWHVDGLRLHLAVGADASLTTIVTAGANAGVYFDWKRAGGSVAARGPSRAEDPESKNLRHLLQTIAGVLPGAVAKVPELRDSGFEFDQVQVGLGELADIPAFGVADLHGEIMGIVVFRKDGRGVRETASVTAPTESVGLIRAPIGERQPLRSASFLSAKEKLPPPALFKISAERLTYGLTKAIRMSTYFLKRADSARSGAYRLKQIEAEFDTSIDGDLVWVVVTGGGQFVLDFDRRHGNSERKAE